MKLLKIVACLMFVAYASAVCTCPSGTTDQSGPGELCDGATTNICSDGAVCSAPGPDGNTGAGEVCDDGDTVDGNGCDNDCTLSCGNGTTDAANNEECDGGADCDSNCKKLYRCNIGVGIDPRFDPIDSENRQDLVEKSAIFAPHLDIDGSKFITDSGTKWQVSVMVSKWYTAAADQVQVQVIGEITCASGTTDQSGAGQECDQAVTANDGLPCSNGASPPVCSASGPSGTTPGTVNLEFVSNPLQTGTGAGQSRVCKPADLTHTCVGTCDSLCVGSARDGIVAPTEECDDNNDDDNDGCNNNCVKTCFPQVEATGGTLIPTPIANPTGLGSTTAAASADCWEMRTVRIKWAHLTHRSNGASNPQDGLDQNLDATANSGAGTATFRGAVKVTSTRTMRGRLFGTAYTRTAIDTLYWDIVFPLTAEVTFGDLEIFASIEVQVVLTSHEVQLTDLRVTDSNGPTVSAKIEYTTTTQSPFKLKTDVASNTVRTVQDSGTAWVAWDTANAYLAIDSVCPSGTTDQSGASEDCDQTGTPSGLPCSDGASPPVCSAAGGVKYVPTGEVCTYLTHDQCSQNWEIRTTNIDMNTSGTPGDYFVNTHDCRIDVHLEVTFNPECATDYESTCRSGHTLLSGTGETCDQTVTANGKPCEKSGVCYAYPECPLGAAAGHTDVFRVRLQTSRLCPDSVTTVAFNPNPPFDAYSDSGRTVPKSAYILGQQVWFRAQFQVTTADAPDLATCAIDTITVDPTGTGESWYIYSTGTGATDVWVSTSNTANDFTYFDGSTDVTDYAHCRVDFSIQLFGCPAGAAVPGAAFTGGRCFDITRFGADTQNIILRVSFTFAGFLKLGKAELLQQPGEENSDQANVEIGIASDEVEVEQPTTGGDNVVPDGGQTILLEGESSDVFIYIIIGVCAFVALLIGALVMYLRRSKKEKKSNAITPQVQVQMQPRVGVVTQQQPCMAATA